MTAVKEIGEVEKIPFEIQQIEWRIPDFFTFVEGGRYNCFASPTFSVSGVLWQLRLWPRWTLSFEFMDLYLAQEAFGKDSDGNLASDAHREYPLEYYFGLKKCDDSLEHLVSGTVTRNRYRNTKGEFIKKAQLLEQKSKLVPDNILTIICTMTWETAFSHNSTQTATVVDKTQPLKLIRLDKLSENFKDLLGDKGTGDTTLKVKDKEYKAHRSILIARSSVFAATFKHDTLEKQTGIIIISDCDPDSFHEFLDYLYSGKLEGLSYRSALNLYCISDKYDVQELKAFCVECLMQCLTVENICDVIVFADKFEETALFAAAQDFFNRNVSNILVTSEWECLMKKDYRLANKLFIAMPKMKYGD